MSAFIVSDEHIRALVGFARGRGSYLPFKFRDKSNAELFDLLRKENYRSVNHRYAEQTEVPADYKPGTARDYSAVEILKACDCLEYQSCENEDYRSTEAFEFLDSIRGLAISALPGYEAAPWGIDEAEPTMIPLSELVFRPSRASR